MGKLSDLWKSLSVCPPENKLEIQQKINRIEQYCIDNNFAGIKELTDWSKRDTSNKKSYRFDSERDGGHNPPEGALFGKDRCRACIYNRHVYCDPKDLYGHFAKV